MPSFYGSLSVSAVVDTAPLDAMAAAMPGRVDKILAEVCAAIEGDAKQNAPVDTGALRNSIAFERVGELIYSVHDGVFYGVFNELGTRYMRAHPFFIPAVERNADLLVSKIPAVFR